MPVDDSEIMGLVAQDRDPQLLEAARQEYPILKDYEIGYKYAPRQDAGYLEFWPKDEEGSTDFPRPKEFPIGTIGVEVRDPKTRPIDVVGDVASHYLIYEDPRIKSYYDQFQRSLNPGQYDRLRNQYQFAQQNFGETRPYEKWYEMTGLPGYFRGYPFQQWDQEFNETAYTQQQRQMFDEMMQYLKTGK